MREVVRVREVLLRLIGVMLMAAFPAGSAAEEALSALEAGDRVRLAWAAPRGGRFTGTVLEMHADALVLRSAAEPVPRRVALADVERLEVARGRRGHVVEGALIGFVPGFAYGFVLGRLLGCDDQPDCSGIAAGLTAGTMVGGVTAVAGGLVGLAVRTDRWLPVPLPAGRRPARLGAAVVPARGGVAAAISLSF